MNRGRLLIPVLSIILVFLPGTSSGKTISLTLSQLEQWLILYSPELKITLGEENLKNLKEYLESGLSPANPEFSFKQESLKEGNLNDMEQEFELTKSFPLPWIYSSRQSGWKHMTRSIRQSVLETRNRMIAEMKAEYVEIALLRKNVNEYILTGKILEDLLKSLIEKEKEGFISPLNLKMIRISLLNTRSRIMEMESLLERKEKKWKQAAGISPEKEVIFATDIHFIPAGDCSLMEVLRLYRLSPGFRKWEHSGRALKEKVTAEKMEFLPEVTLNAGFKRIKDGPKGPVFGISFGIPLLNLNSIMVKKAKLERKIHESRKDWETGSDERNIAHWFGQVKKYSRFLEKAANPMEHPSTETAPLLDAYQEGVLDVNGLISGIQLFLDGMESYHKALAEYYSYIFRIRGITGKKLVIFN